MVRFEGVITEIHSLYERLISEKENFGTKVLEEIHLHPNSEDKLIAKRFIKGAKSGTASIHRRFARIVEVQEEVVRFQLKICLEGIHFMETQKEKVHSLSKICPEGIRFMEIQEEEVCSL